MIITSQQTVKHLFKLIEEAYFPTALIKDKKIISVGQATAKALQRKGLYASYIAKEESGEGIGKILDQIKWREGNHVFYPKSSLARPLIKDYLARKGVSFEALDLYEPKSILLVQKPNLNDYDEIVLTSSSCVKSFFENFKDIPPHLKVVCKGHVTERNVQK